MKLTKKILLILFIVMIVGIAGKTFFPFNFAGLILFVGMVGYILGGILYIILSLINKKCRIEAGMIATAFPLVIGVLFTSMRWPFGGPLIIVGSSTMLMISIGLLIYLLTQKRNVLLGVLYAATGFSSLFFCFKIMLWPGSTQLFISAFPCVIVAVILFYLKKQKMNSAAIVLLLINVLIVFTFFASESRLYSYKHLNTIQPEINFPENYHIYAWMLYKEGKIEEAKTNLRMAIHEAKNPNNKRADEMEDGPEVTIQRYERAMVLLNTNNWKELERPVNYRY